MNNESDWTLGERAWALLAERHPELGIKPGLWTFHNFLRRHRDTLVAQDAIRRARGRYWIAHKERFLAAAFDCATGFDVVGEIK